jgi:hypothetical protein
MLGKSHNAESRLLISNYWTRIKLNPMFGYTHISRMQVDVEARLLISNLRFVVLCDSNNQNIITFKNNLELSNFLVPALQGLFIKVL